MKINKETNVFNLGRQLLRNSHGNLLPLNSNSIKYKKKTLGKVQYHQCLQFIGVYTRSYKSSQHYKHFTKIRHNMGFFNFNNTIETASAFEKYMFKQISKLDIGRNYSQMHCTRTRLSRMCCEAERLD